MEEITNRRFAIVLTEIKGGRRMSDQKDTLLHMRKELLARIAANRRSLKKMPEGSLGRRKKPDGGYYYYWDHYHDGKRVRQSAAGDEPMIYALARKSFLEKAIKADMKRTEALDRALKRMPEDDEEYDLDKISAFSSLPKKGFLFADDPRDWLRIVQSEDQGEYSKNNIHPTNSGVMTKSKDEARIGNLFEAKGIAYRYEKAYGMNFYHKGKGCRVNKIFHPDFTIYPEHAGHILWEHCGVMDDPEYFKRLMARIQIYYENGYTLWDNLILSFDNSNGSFNEERIRLQIKLYFNK